MKNSILFSLAFFVLSGCSLFSRSEQAQPKPQEKDVPFQARDSADGIRKRLLVLPFLDEKIGRPQAVLDAARNGVSRQLNQTRRFVLIKPSDVPQDLGKFIGENRQYDLDRVAPIASQMGLAAVIEGKILEIKAKRMGDDVGVIRKVQAKVEATVRVRVVAAKSGRIVLDETRTGLVEASSTRVGETGYSSAFLEEDPMLVQQAVEKAFASSVLSIAKAVEKLSWEGRVAMVQGERIFVNAGRLSGIQVGDILKVTEEGDEVFDPETGGFIGKAPGRMKGTVEVISYFGQDGAIGLIHSGSGFKDNDRVELY